jgi:uroporphyrinogen-III decarboxylase
LNACEEIVFLPKRNVFGQISSCLPVTEIKKEVRKMITEFGVQKYIVNLGHGITPNIPVDHARAFVDAVKEVSGEC